MYNHQYNRLTRTSKCGCILHTPNLNYNSLIQIVFWKLMLLISAMAIFSNATMKICFRECKAVFLTWAMAVHATSQHKQPHIKRQSTISSDLLNLCTSSLQRTEFSQTYAVKPLLHSLHFSPNTCSKHQHEAHWPVHCWSNFHHHSIRTLHSLIVAGLIYVLLQGNQCSSQYHQNSEYKNWKPELLWVNILPLMTWATHLFLGHPGCQVT